jgi:hypothetical protein
MTILTSCRVSYSGGDGGFTPGMNIPPNKFFWNFVSGFENLITTILKCNFKAFRSRIYFNVLNP